MWSEYVAGNHCEPKVSVQVALKALDIFFLLSDRFQRVGDFLLFERERYLKHTALIVNTEAPHNCCPNRVVLGCSSLHTTASLGKMLIPELLDHQHL